MNRLTPVDGSGEGFLVVEVCRALVPHPGDLSWIAGVFARGRGRNRVSITGLKRSCS